MAETINYPPFPSLTWDDYAWVGEFRLPSWFGFQSRRGAYASLSDEKPSDGTVELTVDGEENVRPTPEQIAAFQHLILNEAKITQAVSSALIEYYNAIREEYLDDDETPEITDNAGLRRHVGLGSVHILSLARDGVACIGFEFGCVWDDEHGAGVMTHRGRVIETGKADCSFVQWIAQRALDAT